MAQAAKQLKKIKDIEAQALQEQKEKEESNRKRRNRSRDRKKKVRGRRRPRTEAPGGAAGRRSAALGLTPRERQGGWRAGRAASGPRGSGEPPRDSFQHLEQRPALRRNFCRLRGGGACEGLHRGAQGCSPGFLGELLWVNRAGAPEVVLSPPAQVTTEFSCAAGERASSPRSLRTNWGDCPSRALLDPVGPRVDLEDETHPLGIWQHFMLRSFQRRHWWQGRGIPLEASLGLFQPDLRPGRRRALPWVIVGAVFHGTRVCAKTAQGSRPLKATVAICSPFFRSWQGKNHLSLEPQLQLRAPGCPQRLSRALYRPLELQGCTG